MGITWLYFILPFRVELVSPCWLGRIIGSVYLCVSHSLCTRDNGTTFKRYEPASVKELF